MALTSLVISGGMVDQQGTGSIIYRPVPEAQRPAQLTAFFTRAPILTSSVAVNCFSAKATGHTVPSSRFALSLKPSVAYLVLNLCEL
jgi:hypothetical protein